MTRPPCHISTKNWWWLHGWITHIHVINCQLCTYGKRNVVVRLAQKLNYCWKETHRVLQFTNSPIQLTTHGLLDAWHDMLQTQDTNHSSRITTRTMLWTSRTTGLENRRAMIVLEHKNDDDCKITNMLHLKDRYLIITKSSTY